MGISKATYYNWKKKHGGLGVPELRRLKWLEAENPHLKQLVSDLRPVQRRHAAHHLVNAYRISARRACRTIGFQRTSFSYLAYGRDDMVSRQRLRELAQVRVHYSSQRPYTLMRREGWPDNPKCVHRLHSLEGLNLCSKRPRCNRAAAHRLERFPLGRPHQCGSTDFVADNLFDGRKVRALTIVGNYSRQCLAIHVG